MKLGPCAYRYLCRRPTCFISPFRFVKSRDLRDRSAGNCVFYPLFNVGERAEFSTLFKPELISNPVILNNGAYYAKCTVQMTLLLIGKIEYIHDVNTKWNFTNVVHFKIEDKRSFMVEKIYSYFQRFH